MLVEFSVSNFRSIRERLTLSTVSSKGKKKNQVLKTGFTAAPLLNEVVAIYGANGAGKTNVLKAMEFFQDFVRDSYKDKQLEEDIEIESFLFDADAHVEASEFEVVFIHKGYLFQYGFTADSRRIYEEWLYATPKNTDRQKPQRWFERNVKDIKKSYVRPELKGPKAQWKALTRENALFLSTAVQNNSHDFRIPFEWIVAGLSVILTPESMSHHYTAKQVANGRFSNQINRFMKQVDPHIQEVKVEEVDYSFPYEHEDLFSEKVKKEIAKLKERKDLEAYTVHKCNDGSVVKLSMKNESDGTQRLFNFSGPILDTLENGYTLVVDELHNSLHPLAMQNLIKLFRSKRSNKSNAQFIFTTHDVSIMNHLDRDEVWILDKDKSGQTVGKSVSEYKGDRSEQLDKRYLGGRFGGLPHTTSFYDG